HLLPVLKNVRDAETGPILVHVVTEKGHGYAPAEASDDKYHGVARFNVVTGAQMKPKQNAPSYTRVFADSLIKEAHKDQRIVAITAAMPDGTGLDLFGKEFPDRTFDVGIAEQHAVTFAGGLATEGLKPVVAIYSTFLQRAYDQLIHDVALQNLPVVFAIDRAGLVGADGATHAGAYDLAFMRCIPNMTIMAASDENECRQMLHTALQQPNPTAVRYPRGAGTGVATVKEFTEIPLGKGEVRRRTSQPEGKRVAILAFGTMVAPSLVAGEELDATVANMRFVKPVDAALVHELAETHDYLVTIEEGCVMGGAGSACVEALMESGVIRPVLQLGLPDQFVDHGDHAKLLAQCGLDGAGIAKSIRERFLSPAADVAGHAKRVA
ncbi:MAG TPA: 1-deoxy-D-xylulose-5-phosphate synthase, partial [Burkholderia sp.]|nr:1-deoxy-D-xylulose-5-phosphate synthase [Burkholderia sp.]